MVVREKNAESTIDNLKKLDTRILDIDTGIVKDDEALIYIETLGNKWDNCPIVLSIGMCQCSSRNLCLLNIMFLISFVGALKKNNGGLMFNHICICQFHHFHNFHNLLL